MDRQIVARARRGVPLALIAGELIREGVPQAVVRAAIERFRNARIVSGLTTPRFAKRLNPFGGEAPPTVKRQRPEEAREIAMAPVYRDGGVYTNDKHHRCKKTLGRITKGKLAKIGTSDVYDMWQSMGLYGSTNGTLDLGRYQQAVSQAGTTTGAMVGWTSRPYYLFDLTGCRNASGGSIICPQMAFRLCSNSGAFGWTVLRGQDISTGQAASDVGTSSWQYFKTPRTNAYIDCPLQRALLDWVKVQGVFWGSKQQTHRVHVELIQIEDWMCPAIARAGEAFNTALYTGVVGMIPGDNGNQLDANQNYSNLIARLVDNPFGTWSHEAKKPYVKVLHKKTLVFNPVASFEENGTAKVHKQTLNEFFKMGRKLKYDWETTSTGNVLDNSYLETAIDRGAHGCVVHPKARVFLRIYCDNYIDGTAPDYAPSFDLKITRKLIIDAV